MEYSNHDPMRVLKYPSESYLSDKIRDEMVE